MGDTEHIVTRIAPSPTGALHVGTARTALFNYLFAKKHNGTFIVRIEDTDKERSKKVFEADILEGLEWLGLSHDKLYRQSEHLASHKQAILKLIESDKAYISKEKSKQDPGKTVEVVRLRNPGKKITFAGMIRGDITFDTTELGDFVIARSVEDPLYHLAVVVDDHEMGVTDVIRGEDHISNTPRQILIQEACGYPRPRYAHIPLLLGSDRSKLSKRKGETSISSYRKDYLPEALVNYLALLGWNPGTDREYFTLPELVEQFDLQKVQKGGAIFDIEKLRSMNHAYIQKMDPKAFMASVKEYVPAEFSKILPAILPVLQERIHTLSETGTLFKGGEFDFYLKPPSYSPDILTWKDDAAESTKKHLETVKTFLETIPAEYFTPEKIKDALWDYATKEGRGSVLWPLRVALSGRERSPEPFQIASVLGKAETLSRIDTALSKI